MGVIIHPEKHILAKIAMPAKQGPLDELIESHLWLAEAIGKRYFNIRAQTEGDILQEARLALTKAASKYNPEIGPFKAYAATAIYFHLNDLYREELLRANLRIDPEAPLSSGSPESLETLLDQLPACEVGPVREAERNDIRRILARCRKQLSLPDRQILEMRMEGLTYKDIAHRINVSAPAAHKRVQKALESIKPGLLEHGINGPQFMPAMQNLDRPEERQAPLPAQLSRQKGFSPSLIVAIAVLFGAAVLFFLLFFQSR